MENTLEALWEQDTPKNPEQDVFGRPSFLCTNFGCENSRSCKKSSGNFARVGDRISLKRLRARPAVYGFHLPTSFPLADRQGRQDQRTRDAPFTRAQQHNQDKRMASGFSNAPLPCLPCICVQRATHFS